MRRTENLNLPIYDNPESDIFKINDVNNAHETIDKQYKELKDILENKQYITSGTTDQRPTIAIIGQQYFDTDLNKPIWRNKNNNGWVDANGTEV